MRSLRGKLRAAWAVLMGRAVVYGVHFVSPVRIRLHRGDRLSLIGCRVEGGGISVDRDSWEVPT